MMPRWHLLMCCGRVATWRIGTQKPLAMKSSSENKDRAFVLSDERITGIRADSSREKRLRSRS